MFSTVKILLCISALVSTSALCQLIQNPIYIIRNAETEAGSDNLSTIGSARASNCLPEVFGPNSQYDIGLVVSCGTDSESSSCAAAFQTAAPVATFLNLSVDTTCDTTRDTASRDCIKQTFSTFSSSSSKGILLVWDQNHFENLGDEFGLRNLPQDQPDAIFTLRNGIFFSQTSQNCPAIDFPTTDSTLGGIPSIGPVSQVATPLAPPSSTGLSLSQWDALISNLYYTTTFSIPDPVPTGTPVLVRRSQEAGLLNSKRRSRRCANLSKRFFGKYPPRL